ILAGRGCTEFWRSGEEKRIVEWQKDSMLVLPISVWHRFINLSDEPAVYLAINNAPLMVNLFMNTEFVYGERFAFPDLYVPSDTYFGSDPKLAALPYGELIYHNHFIPNFNRIK